MPSRARSKMQATINPQSREYIKALNRRNGDRRLPRTTFEKFKLWLTRKWANWKRWLQAAFNATGMAMGVYSFFRSFGSKTMLAMLALGFLLAPIET